VRTTSPTEASSGTWIVQYVIRVRACRSSKWPGIVLRGRRQAHCLPHHVLGHAFAVVALESSSVGPIAAKKGRDELFVVGAGAISGFLRLISSRRATRSSGTDRNGDIPPSSIIWAAAASLIFT